MGKDRSPQSAANSDSARNNESYRRFFLRSSLAIARIDLAEPIAADVPASEFIEHALRTGTIGEANAAMAALHGHDHAMKLARVAVKDLLADVDASTESSSTLTHRLGERWITSDFTADVNDGRIKHLWLVQRDATDQKTMQQSLETAHAMDRAKSELLALAGHELRTPLTPILLLVTLLEQNDELPAEAKEDLASIRQSVEAETQMIDHLLDMSRLLRNMVTIKPKEVDAHDAIRKAILACPRPEGHVIDTQLTAAKPIVLGDATRVQQMVGHLLSNAVKFTPASGKITVRTSNPQPDRLIIEVADSGDGIAADRVSTLLEPFSTQTRLRERGTGGMGIGLAITNGFAKLMNAQVTVKSDGKGKGSIFTIDFPVRP